MGEFVPMRSWRQHWEEEAPYGKAAPWMANGMSEDHEVKKLNLGCGSLLFPIEQGWVNLDMVAGPNIVRHDMNAIPWPFEDGEFQYIFMSHILEHICPANFIRVIDEMFRVSSDGAIWEMHGPHPESISDSLQRPDHQTLIGPLTFCQWVHSVETASLGVVQSSEVHRLEPIDLTYYEDRVARYTQFYSWSFRTLSDYHLRKYLGRRLGEFMARLLGKPRTCRLVYRVRHYNRRP